MIKKCYGTLEQYGKKEFDGEYITGEAHITQNNEVKYLEITAKCIPEPYNYSRIFEKNNAVTVVCSCESAEEFMGQHVFSPFWASPVFTEDFKKGTSVQYLLIKRKNDYMFILPISNEHYNTTISCGDDCININVNMPSGGFDSISGTIAVISTAKDPYDAIKNSFIGVEKLIKTPRKIHKEFPEILNYLGWCSWNAFYHDVTEDKIIRKLSEFKEKNIPIKWILIDDGWSQTQDMKLLSIFEDKNKFPNGLKHTINLVKSEYGIEKVGVWHSFTGYWYGTDFENEDTQIARHNRFIPNGYEFFSKWHTYLKKQGVDFVKVDCQGNAVEFLKNRPEAFSLLSEIYNGLEDSASENFDFIINCMGMNNINSFNHKSSVLQRSSDDFYPDKQDSFRTHAMCNIYNSVFVDELFYCDFDMWQSEHFDAKRNAFLRFASGGPVYLSDELNKSDSKYIDLFTDTTGRFERPLDALKPTYDCLFGFKNILKAFNRTKNGYLIVVYNFGEEQKTEISSKDFGENRNFKMSEYLSGTQYTISNNQPVNITISKDDVKLFYIKKID